MSRLTKCRRVARLGILLVGGVFLFLAQPSNLCAGEAPPKKIARPPAKKYPTNIKKRLYKKQAGVYQEILPNGLTLILKEMHSAPVVTIQGWVKFGSIDEGKLLGSGLAHYIEHTIFKGTPTRKVGQFSRDIRSAGGVLNAYTSFDRTVLHCTVASRYFAKGLDAIADVMQHSLFVAKEVIKEQDVITREQERYLDSPGRILYSMFNQAIWQRYPRRLPVGGYINQFLKLNRADLLRYYRRFYIPNNCAMVIVGDFSIQKKLPEIRAAFADWERSPEPTPEVPRDLWPVGSHEVSDYHKNTRTTLVKVGWPSCTMRDQAMYPLDVLASILGQGRTSRLYQRLRVKEKMVQGVSAGNNTPGDHWGYFSVTAALYKATDRDRFLAIVDEEIARVVKQGVTPQEVKRAIKKVAAANVFGRSTVEGVAGSLGSGWLNGDIHFDTYYLSQIKQVTPVQVQAAAAKWLKKTPRAVATLYPGEPPVAKTTGVAPTSGLSKHSIAKSVLPNGVRLAIKRNPGVPEAQICIAFLGGTRYEPVGKEGINDFMASLLDKGTTTRTAEKIFQTIEDIGGSVSASGGRQSVIIKARVLREDLPTVLALLADIIQHPKFAPKWVELSRISRQRSLANRLRNAQQTNFDNLYHLTFGNHPYGRLSLGNKASLKSITRADLLAYQKEILLPQNCVISIVGDVDIKAAQKQVTAAFAKWTGTFTAPTTPKLVRPSEPNEKRVEKSGINIAELAIAFPTVSQGNPEVYAFDVIRSILSGLGSRLFVDMRDRQSLAYSVGCFHSTGIDGGAFIFYISPSPQKKGKLNTYKAVVDRSLESFLAQVKTLREKPITEKELKSAKENLIGSREIGLQTNGSQAMSIALDTVYGFPSDRAFRYAEKINAVTIDEVQRVAKKYFDVKKLSTAITVPKGKP